MNSKILSFLICLYLPAGVAHAHGDETEHSGKYRVLKEMQAPDGKGVTLMVREGGHLLGQRFQVELRAQCEKTTKDPIQWEVQDSFSVCDLSPDSAKVNSKKTAVALKTKMADIKFYDDQVAQGIKHPEERCQEQTTVKKFSLKTICK